MLVRVFIIFVFSALLVSSCHSPAPCFNKNMENVSLKWGSFNDKDNSYDGYVLSPTGLLQKYYRDSAGVERSRNITYISHEKVCKVLNYYYWVMKKVQTCYEPGNNLKYLIFDNAHYNTSWRAVWNENFNTGSNKYLKVVFDSLRTVTNGIEKE